MVRSGKTVTEVSNSLGVARSLLQYWKRQLDGEAADPFFGLGTDIDITITGDENMPAFGRQAELVYGLRNFVENAVGFADKTVTLQGHWNGDRIFIDIRDDGPGFDPVIKPRLGEPYVSGRSDKSHAGGLGLGFFVIGQRKI